MKKYILTTIVCGFLLVGCAAPETDAPNADEPVTVAPTVSAEVTVNAACGSMNDDECAWVEAAKRILNSSVEFEKVPGESTASTLSKMRACIDQATSDAMRLPVPPRCVKAATLLQNALSEAWLAARAAETALDFNTEETVKAANSRRQSAGEMYGQCDAEFRRLRSSPN